MKTETKPKDPEWTYSSYRASLRCNGNTWALVSPDGRAALKPEQATELLAMLNSYSSSQAEVARLREALMKCAGAINGILIPLDYEELSQPVFKRCVEASMAIEAALQSPVDTK